MEPANEYLVSDVIEVNAAGVSKETPALICTTEGTWIPLTTVDAFFQLALRDTQRWFEILEEIKEALEAVDGGPLEA